MKATRVMATGLAVFLAAVAWAGFSGTEVYLPSVGSGAGAQGSHWRTSVWLRNPGATVANVTLEFLARGTSNTGPATAYETIAPGETIRVADLMADYFGMSSGFGALRITSSERILAASRIFSVPAGGDEAVSVGQLLGGVPVEFAIGAGERTGLDGAFQFTPTETGPFRYNFGFVETAGGNVTVRVSAYDGFDPATVLGSREYTLGPHGVLQKNLADVVKNPNGDNLRLEIEVVSGSGKIVAFGSQVANGSNDPSTFEMEFPAGALSTGGSGGGGLDRVHHDGTLTGDGTASSPLGVADGAVTAAKLSAAGSSAGQVLMSDGSAVRWQTPSGGGGGGLTLPYSSTISSDGVAFWVINSGNGSAIRAESAGHDGVSGKSQAATKSGVYGVNTDRNGYGVFGRNQALAARGFIGGLDSDLNGGVSVPVGVLGRADGSSGETGVIGLSDGGWGVAGAELGTGDTGVLGAPGAGVIGIVETGDASGSYGVWGIDRTGGIGFAGAFTGDVAITGNLDVQGTKNFRIDHPLDPENRYLYHAAVESDEVLDQYTGNVVLDASGEAVVVLPGWFEAINTDFRYQLTPVGGPAPGLYVAEGIHGNRFRIAGGSPGLTVSWLVTARRNDPYLRNHPFRPERDKPAALRGTYLDPVSWGQPEERGEAWAAHPEVMRCLRRRDAGSEVIR